MAGKTTALDIKHALMGYFRFKRQWICASECLNGDVMAITDKDIIEVEIKISKSDLWRGEAQKYKHRVYKNQPEWFRLYHANRFYMCVPFDLEEEAIKWVTETNKKYGIILYNPDTTVIHIKKTAKTLIEGDISERLKHSIMMRVSAENIGLLGNILRSANAKENA